MIRLVRSVVLGVLVVVPSLAFGHANLVTPTRRTGENIKQGPCGAPPGTPVASFEALQTTVVEFVETIDHPGYYRLALSPEGVDGFPEIILADNIPDIGGTPPPGGREYTPMVEIPDQACERCTLQLIQYMTEDPANPELYFSCADITITAGPGAGDGGTGSGGDAGSGSGGRGDAAASSIGEEEPMIGPTPAVCSAAPARRSGVPLGAAVLAILFFLAGLIVAASPRIGAKVPGSTRNLR